MMTNEKSLRATWWEENRDRLMAIRMTHYNAMNEEEKVDALRMTREIANDLFPPLTSRSQEHQMPLPDQNQSTVTKI